MAQQFVSAINLDQNELQNAVVHHLSTAPSTPIDGQFYYNPVTGLIYVYSAVRQGWIALTWVWRGAYNASSTYRYNDVVTNAGNSYIVVSPTALTGVTPVDTGSQWNLLAAGGAGSVTYTNPLAVPTTLGGITSGTTFAAPQTMQQMWDLFLYPYQTPAFSSFSISGQSQTVEVGTTLSGSKTFTWATSNPSNVQVNSVNILDSNGSTLVSSLGSSGSTSQTIASAQRTSPGSATWTIRGTNTRSNQFSTTFSVSWLWRMYYGSSSNQTLSESEIEALTSNTLTSTPIGTTFNTPVTGYKYFAYPASLPAASLFTDTQTGFDVAMASSGHSSYFDNSANGISYGLVSVTNSFGVATSYRVYRTANQLGAAMPIRLS